MGYRWKYARGLRGVVTSSEDARTTDAGATAASDAAPSNAERRDTDDDVLGASRSLSFDESDAVARGRMDRAPRSSRARETDRDAPMRTVGARPASDDMCIVARHTDRARDALWRKFTVAWPDACRVSSGVPPIGELEISRICQKCQLEERAKNISELTRKLTTSRSAGEVAPLTTARTRHRVGFTPNATPRVDCISRRGADTRVRPPRTHRTASHPRRRGAFSAANNKMCTKNDNPEFYFRDVLAATVQFLLIALILLGGRSTPVYAAVVDGTCASGLDNNEVFWPDAPDVIPFKGADSHDPLAFRHYNATETVLGRPMKDWLRFSVAFWHSIRNDGSDPFGFPTKRWPWDAPLPGCDVPSPPMDLAKRRMRALFELMRKLGVDLWCFHDRDIAPRGETLEETNAMLDEIVEYAAELQHGTDIRPLWGTAQLFAEPHYMHGAATR